MSGARGGKLTVLLVDDHAVVREGYRRLLERHEGIEVIGEAGDAATAHSLCCALDPTVVVMDITLPGMSGLEAMRLMLGDRPNARILVFSMHEDSIFAARAMEGGAFGFVTKASAPHVLVEAVRTIAQGRKYLSPDVAHRIALREHANAAALELTQREREVLRLIAQGIPVKEVAKTIGVNAKTAANYQTIIKQKLGANTAIDLLRRAKELGLVQ